MSRSDWRLSSSASGSPKALELERRASAMLVEYSRNLLQSYGVCEREREREGGGGGG